ncbi:unnamed protein product, partial [marine sediment metagenome]
MPIDRAQLVSPFAVPAEPELPPDPGRENKFLSPFQVREEAEIIHEKRPDIGPVEEIEGMLTLGSSLVATPIAGLGGLSQILSNEIGLGEKIPPEKQIEWIADKLTYLPRTEGGREFA